MLVLLPLSLLATLLWVPFDTFRHVQGWQLAALNYARLFVLGYVIGLCALAAYTA